MRDPVPQRGFTLIEVLIAMVVLSIGMLGLAGLQTSGLRYTHTSYLLSLATQQAEDMVERIRANPLEAENVGGYYDSVSGSKSVAVNCSTADCNQLQRAEYDHSEWNAKNTTLFGQTGTVARSGEVFLVTLSWQEVSDLGSPAAKSYTVAFRP